MVRILVEKTVEKPGGMSSTQFMWDCYCYTNDGGIILSHISDPATCKRIGRQTKWAVIEPMLTEIYNQLKAEIDTLHSDRKNRGGSNPAHNNRRL